MNAVRAAAGALLLAWWLPAHAVPVDARFDVRIERNGEQVKQATVVATEAHPAVVEATRPFKVAVAACAGSDARRYQEGGTGKAGVTVVLGLMAGRQGAAQVSVSLASAEVASMVAIKAGACRGQTPAMLKFDAKAMFGLRPGEHQQLQVGDYAVTVRLRDLRPSGDPDTGAVSI